jgi:gamma-glutamyltranspeptidase / glutathione hydrolase
MVATVNPIATDAALDAFERGGNAVDAAVAAGLTLGVVDPHNSGIGGSAFVVIRKASGELIVIDGRETAPGKAHRDMYVVDGKLRPELARRGPLASGVPGALAAYDLALKRAGKLTLADAIRPAAEVAERGFPASPAYAKSLKRSASALSKYPASKAAFLKPDGSAYRAGEIVRQPDLACTYRQIAIGGAEWFYNGEFAVKLDEFMRDAGGIMTLDDLKAYRAIEREPVVSTYRGYTVVGMPPPSSGGVHVAQILNILEHFDVASMSAVDRIHVTAEAMKLAFADRAFWLGDPDFTKVPKGLTDKSYAADLAKRIDVNKATKVERHGDPPNPAEVYGRRHTTHVAVADAEGNFVAMTQTVNGTYGSRVVVPGTGVLLNNEMDDFSIQPGVPNSAKLVGAEANAIAPGKRMLSSMSPTIVLKDGKPFMTVGAAGAPRIITQVLSAIVNRIDLKTEIGPALAAPRFHHQWSPDELVVERKMPTDVVAGLKAKGHVIKLTDDIAIANGISYTFDGKQLAGASDPRTQGKAAGR